MSMFRIKCQYKLYDPLRPHDGETEDEKYGSGFLVCINRINYIMTAHHVVSNGLYFTATSPNVPDGTVFQLTLKCMNSTLDVALLHNEALSSLKSFELGTSNACGNVPIHVYGFPDGFRFFQTKGAVTGRNSYPHNRIQIDASVNHGNSGGPVVADNKVLGVITSAQEDMENTYFFSPIDEIMVALSRMFKQRTDEGLHCNALFVGVDSAAGFSVSGALVAHSFVSELQRGDVVTHVALPKNGTMIEVNPFLRSVVKDIWLHDTIDFRDILDSVGTPTFQWKMLVSRNGKSQSVTVPCGKNKFPLVEHIPDVIPVSYYKLYGLLVQQLSKSHDQLIPQYLYDTLEYQTQPKLLITYVHAGCPFTLNTMEEVKGKLIVAVFNENQNRIEVSRIQDLVKIDIIQAVELNTGVRLGVDAYQRGLLPKELRQTIRGRLLET